VQYTRLSHYLHMSAGVKGVKTMKLIIPQILLAASVLLAAGAAVAKPP
jgi:uncharacterized membrane protein YGL010W